MKCNATIVEPSRGVDDSDERVMMPTVQDRLLRRELGDTSRYSAIKGIYGDKSWINDLDIVNELGGHSGCVNALR